MPSMAFNGLRIINVFAVGFLNEFSILFHPWREGRGSVVCNMAAYSYVALDSAGKKQKGVLQGDSAKGVRGQLRAQGLTPLSVEVVSEAGTRAGGGFSFLQRK